MSASSCEHVQAWRPLPQPPRSRPPARRAAEVYASGGTLAQHYAQLQARYGTLHYRSSYFVASPPSLSAAVFERLRAYVPASIGGAPVTSVRDLGTGVDTAQPGERSRTANGGGFATWLTLPHGPG